MPNLKGFSRLEVLNLFNLLNIECTFEGYGHVIDQSIKEGEIIDINKPIQITLKQKYEID